MKKLFLFLLFFILSFFLISESLNLVKLQKKEKERRKNISKSQYVLTNDRISEYSLKRSKTFVDAEVPVSILPKTKPKKKEKIKDEKYWRGRLNSVNNGIEQVRKQIQETQSSLNKASSDFLIATTPSLQQELKQRVNNLQRQMAELKASFQQRKSAKEKFLREARREGALPGWLR